MASARRLVDAELGEDRAYDRLDEARIRFSHRPPTLSIPT
jgi:hypothetical protein